MNLQRKLEILADAAKYDASCASSGTEQRDSSDRKGLGSTAPGMGICYSYAPDGRCISLLKILLTNACNYDCLYCVNRASSNVPRALHRRGGGAAEAGFLIAATISRNSFCPPASSAAPITPWSRWKAW